MLLPLFFTRGRRCVAGVNGSHVVRCIRFLAVQCCCHSSLLEVIRFLAVQVENFRLEKVKFDQEVAKWDDTGNDIIVLAKHMCMIMMEMTDFTR